MNWNCPCQEWAGVERYEFEFEAEDGQVDFTHTSRTSGRYLLSCETLTYIHMLLLYLFFYKLRLLYENHFFSFLACDNNDFISNLRSCMKYTMTMTAYQLAGNGEEEYRQVDVTTLEGCMYFIIFFKNFYSNTRISHFFF